ncbi:60S ribosomal protein L13-like [Cimex lectularius]|uniref:60S ribosomal protein L13 n=1 Tax=Cimex lectularius TaxID=79782 RepID=A0A8I6S357_CIMLE|nr:60S ribosomal protein L13-like [Cimex lectularius]
MAPKSNNMIPNAHFHKKWQDYVRIRFNQPGRKQRQRLKRIKKHARLAPRPTKKLRPAVRCPTVRYHMKLREGRGFTLEEVRRAGLCPAYARTIGITVDPRRRNKSVEGILLNVQRLKEYKSRLILFPKSSRDKLRKGQESTKEERSLAKQYTGKLLPIKQTNVNTKARQVTEEENKFSAWEALRKARKEVKMLGKNIKKMKEAAECYDDGGKLRTRKKKSDD